MLISSCSRIAPATEDIIEVAKVIAAEACSEGEMGMWLVANTIANRAESWSMTPHQVVTQPHQFVAYSARNKHELYLQCKPTADYLAANIMELKDYTNGALYFRLHGKLGHIFYRKGEILHNGKVEYHQ